MGLMDKFSDPSLFDSLSFGDKMAGSAITMLMGMGITFVVLMLLWVLPVLLISFLPLRRKLRMLKILMQ